MSSTTPKQHTDSTGTRWWELPDGQLRREDGPAYVEPGGYEEWFYRGRRHNLAGPALLRPANDYKEWFVNGKRHRGARDWAKAALEFQSIEPTENAVRALLAKIAA